MLRFALFEYVDDYFAAERAETVKHAMNCFARIVTAMFGESTIAADKLVCGRSLEVLGVYVNLTADKFQNVFSLRVQFESRPILLISQ